MSKNKQKEKPQSKFQVFFMVIFIPAIFAVILAVALLYYFGINVGEQFQKAGSFLPFIEEQQDEEELLEEETIAQLEHENNIFSQQIQQLESELALKEEEIEALEAEIIQMQSEELSDEEQAETVADVHDIVSTLEDMTASRAADIVSNLPQEEAATYLRMMHVNSRSDILGRLDAELAAELLSQLAN